ncbi:MAG: hypothetical protein NT154_46610, partial [Verrucomicrobia bacterium]|nr:hypothetical protein [Verrucomicrobiota bacterium]
VFCFFLGFVPSILAQMVNPAIDAPDQPFSYPVAPTDAIGVRDARGATEITPEGYLHTGYGELMFLLGYPPRPAAQRIRILENGYLPIIHYEYKDGPVVYAVTAFSHTLPDDSNLQNPVNFIRVVARNLGATARTSYFGVAFRYTGAINGSDGIGDYRFWGPTLPGSKARPGVEFDPNWKYSFQEDAALRSGKLVYLAPTNPKPYLWLTTRDVYTGPRTLRILPDTPLLMTQYALKLAPGATQTLIFKMPLEPFDAADAAKLSALRSATFEEAFRQTAAWWEKELGRGIQITLAEKKVTDTFRASQVYDMLARYRVGDDYIQTVNKFQYNAFFLRDGAYMVHAYDLAGRHDLARQCLEYFFRFQRPDGNFVSQEGQFDGWGQAMWAFGQHYKLTRDRRFAERAFPAVKKAVAWLRQARRTDPLHLMPATNPGDAEFTTVAAHITGYNFWALAGLRNAMALAVAVGTAQDAKEFQEEYDDYSRTFFGKLDEITAKTNGYMPPGVDVAGGQDWGNLLALYPEQILPPFDAKVTGTLRATRAKYAEGLMTYAGLLHHYLTMKNTESWTIRGEQPRALEELYAILLHTSATNAGFEFFVRPWADRDIGQNIMPHGWFAAKYIGVVRNMLMREQENELHLLSVLSPAWSGTGQMIEVQNAPSHFGPVAFQANFRENGMSMELRPRFEVTPSKVVIHLPWFVTPGGARVDGKQVPVNRDRLEIPASAQRIDVTWKRNQDVAGFSYREAVEAYKQEYRRRYQQFLRDGAPPPRPLIETY